MIVRMDGKMIRDLLLCSFTPSFVPLKSFSLHCFLFDSTISTSLYHPIVQSFKMTADAAFLHAPLATSSPSKAPAVKQPTNNPTPTKKPWRETPLVESANLSEAAGWSVNPPLHQPPPSLQDPQ